jgi:hypothetical protein
LRRAVSAFAFATLHACQRSMGGVAYHLIPHYQKEEQS